MYVLAHRLFALTNHFSQPFLRTEVNDLSKNFRCNFKFKKWLFRYHQGVP